MLERRVELAPDEPARLGALQKLGAVYAERLKEPPAAARTWRRVLDASPGHARALRVLRESYFAANDWDGLEELYASQNDWEGLADFLTVGGRQGDRAPREARALVPRRQGLRGQARDARARDAFLRARAHRRSPADARAAARLVPTYEKEEQWSRLPALNEILLGAAEGDEEQVAWLKKLAAVSGGPLADKNAAVGYARRAYELSSDDENLELLESWSRAAASWGAFVEAVEARLKRKKGLNAESRRALRLKLAGVYARELAKLDEAVAVYRELVELDPTDLDTVAAFDEILRANGRKDDLRWLLQLRADQVEGEAKADIFEEWATLEEEVFGDPARAIELFRKVDRDLEPARRRDARPRASSPRRGRSTARPPRSSPGTAMSERRARRARSAEVELAQLYLDRSSPSRCSRSTRASARSSSAPTTPTR